MLPEATLSPSNLGVASKLGGGTLAPVYCQLIGNNDLNGLSTTGKYMLKEDVSNQEISSSGYFESDFLLDGAGHTATVAGQPFFSEKLNGSTIRNLTLAGKIDVSDDSSGNVYLGALAGQMSGGRIESVYNHASVTYANTSDSNMFAYVGGLLGKASSVAIKNAGNSGDVKSKGGTSYVGGLVGCIFNAGDGASSMVNVYNQGKVNGSCAGGLVGYSTQNLYISRSYNEGEIEGSKAGGLIGYESVGGIGYTLLRQVFNTGAVTGGDYAGGLIGMANKSTVDKSYNTGSVTGGNENSEKGGVLVGKYDGAAPPSMNPTVLAPPLNTGTKTVAIRL